MKAALLLSPVLLPALLAALWRMMRLKGNALRRGFIVSGFLCAFLSALNALLPEAGEISLRGTDLITLSFRVDGICKVYLMLLSVLWPGAAVYAAGYLRHDENQGQFFFYFGLTQGVLCALVLSGNLFTFFLFYVGMALLSAPLVAHSGDKEAARASVEFTVHSLAGAFCVLIGMGVIGALGGSGDFAAGLLTDAQWTGKEGLLLTVLFLMLLGFGAKAGLYPMHGWLPSAHPVAPAPASAVLSGVITKMGVLGVIRVLYQTAGVNRLRGTWVQYALLILALVTILMGSALAFNEKKLKKRLAYSSVSQVSYVLFGLFTMTEMGFIGAMLHLVIHALIKNTLFMGAGAIIHQTGKTDVDEMDGLGRSMPWTYGCFALASLGLVGIPPTGGFISKWDLALGALDTGIPGSWAGPAVLLLSAVFTTGYLLTFVIRGCFSGDNETLKGVREADVPMIGPMCVYAALILLLGLFPGGLIGYLQGLAGTLL